MAPSYEVSDSEDGVKDEAASVRAASEELGEGNFALTYNERTGRPVRKSAGQRSFLGYVNHDTLPAIECLDSEDDKEDEEADDDDDNDSDRKGSLLTTYKGKRSSVRQPSPPLEPLSLIEDPDYPTLDVFGAIPDDEKQSNSRAATQGGPSRAQVLRLTFNIMPGFRGPLRVDIPRSMLFTEKMASERPTKRVRTSDYHSDDSAIDGLNSFSHPQCQLVEGKFSNNWGWPQMPAEIRNRIYRLLFKQEETFDFLIPYNFQCSSQFLRTCRQVHAEGRQILYSENKFRFERNKETRARYYTPMPTEIGFKDIRLFLTSIGNNITRIRDVWFICDDAPMRSTRGMDPEERRFVHDPNLIECLRIFGRDGGLRKFKIGFHGKRWLNKTDHRFLEALASVRADKAKVVKHPRLLRGWDADSKVNMRLKKDIEDVITRKKKKFPLAKFAKRRLKRKTKSKPKKA